jgi:hypothetical protein
LQFLPEFTGNCVSFDPFPRECPVEPFSFRWGKERFKQVPWGTDQQTRTRHEEASITPGCFVFFLSVFLFFHLLGKTKYKEGREGVIAQ